MAPNLFAKCCFSHIFGVTLGVPLDMTILSGEIKKANHPFVSGITPTGHFARWDPELIRQKRIDYFRHPDRRDKFN
jgi:hypothetical protein